MSTILYLTYYSNCETLKSKSNKNLKLERKMTEQRQSRHFVFLSEDELSGHHVPSEDGFLTGDRASLVSRDGGVTDYDFCGDLGDDQGEFYTRVVDFEDSLPRVLGQVTSVEETDPVDGAHVTLSAELVDGEVVVTQQLVFTV